MVRSNKIILSIIIFILLFKSTHAYTIDPPNKPVHQHITKEAVKIWPLIPFEIKNHTGNSIDAILGISNSPGTGFYNIGDDTITGSGEEDLAFDVNIIFNSNHFFQPDNPTSGNYDDGLGLAGSSYRRALGIWENDIKRNYLIGNINESYYNLGKVAHLLEDASQPSHVLLDCHPNSTILNIFCQRSSGDGGLDDSVLEQYTGNNFQTLKTTYNWTGSNFIGQQYNYENLPNLSKFNWREVEATTPLDKQNIELFRLFWYVAQKTQYFASDDADGNTIYVNLSGNQKTFSPTLWTNDNVTIINNSIDLADDDVGDTGPDVEKETNAMLPHAMKSVAGLYRLFWDAVQVDWKHYHHDLRNTGYTLLKGDLNASNKQIWNYSSAPATDFWDETAIAEIDNDVSDGQEIIVATSNSDQTDGRVYALDGDTNTQLWSFDEPLATEPPSVDDVDGDRIKEVIVGSHDLYLYNIYSNNGTKKWKYLINNQTKNLSH